MEVEDETGVGGLKLTKGKKFPRAFMDLSQGGTTRRKADLNRAMGLLTDEKNRSMGG